MFWLAFLSATCISLFRNIGIDINIPKWKIIYSVLGIDGNALWWGINFYQLGEWFLSVIICLYIIFPLLRIVVLKYPVLSVIGSVMILTGCIVFFKSRMPVECFVAARILEFVLGMLFVRYIKAGDFRWGGGRFGRIGTCCPCGLWSIQCYDSDSTCGFKCFYGVGVDR